MTAVTIDGHRYTIKRLNPFDQLRLGSLGARALGPMFRALSMSGSASEFAQNLLSGGREGQQLGEGLKDVLNQDITVLLGMLGTTIDEIAERIDGEDLVRCIRLAVIGHISTKHVDDNVDIEDDTTYADVVGPRVIEFGILHQLRLIWEVCKINLGPTTAGAPTSPPEAPAPAPQP